MYIVRVSQLWSKFLIYFKEDKVGSDPDVTDVIDEESDEYMIYCFYCDLSQFTCKVCPDGKKTFIQGGKSIFSNSVVCHASFIR